MKKCVKFVISKNHLTEVTPHSFEVYFCVQLELRLCCHFYLCCTVRPSNYPLFKMWVLWKEDFVWSLNSPMNLMFF